MPLLLCVLIGLGLVLLLLAYRMWRNAQLGRKRCRDCGRTHDVVVYVKRTGPHHLAEMLLCPSCADRRVSMAQSLTRKVPVHSS